MKIIEEQNRTCAIQLQILDTILVNFFRILATQLYEITNMQNVIDTHVQQICLEKTIKGFNFGSFVQGCEMCSPRWLGFRMCFANFLIKVSITCTVK